MCGGVGTRACGGGDGLSGQRVPGVGDGGVEGGLTCRPRRVLEPQNPSCPSRKTEHAGCPGALREGSQTPPLQVERGQVRGLAFTQAQLCPPSMRRSCRRPEVALDSTCTEYSSSVPRAPKPTGPPNPRATLIAENCLFMTWGQQVNISSSHKIGIALFT